MIKTYDEIGLHIINATPVEIHGKLWLCIAFEEKDVHMGDMMHLAFMWADDITLTDDLMDTAQTMLADDKVPLLRIHSECLLGDALHSTLCDCGEQLDASFDDIFRNGSGIILYLRQEGRGIGMRAKLACLAVQEGYVNGKRIASPIGSDEANIFFGHKVDEREYAVVTKVLQALGICDVKLMTGNLDKVHAVKMSGAKIHSLTDIDRWHVQPNTRKYNELMQKSKRNYNYSLTSTEKS